MKTTQTNTREQNSEQIRRAQQDAHIVALCMKQQNEAKDVVIASIASGRWQWLDSETTEILLSECHAVLNWAQAESNTIHAVMQALLDAEVMPSRFAVANVASDMARWAWKMGNDEGRKRERAEIRDLLQ